MEKEFKGMVLSGFLMLLVFFLLLGGSVCAFALLTPLYPVIGGVSGALAAAAAIILLCGFVMVEPNEARVVMFFGKYEGTLVRNGFFWLNPFNGTKKIPLKARNLDAAPIKVNDKVGNPIMIGLVMVWKVRDTYKVMFDIDNEVNASGSTVVNTSAARMKTYENFVKIQADAALRRIAGEYAYDNVENHQEVTLRSSGDVVQKRLEAAIAESLEIAGIEVVEARISHLAYAPEIAAVMLRRQQADAILSARHKIVEGAVDMVQMALERLKQENVVDLDDDKKAAMVSNLLVVLCADESAQPVVNTGTLHQ